MAPDVADNGIHGRGDRQTLRGGPMTGATERIVGIDWGTTNCRAYVFDPEGSVLANAETDAGMKRIGAKDYPACRGRRLWYHCPDAVTIRIAHRQVYQSYPV